MFAREVVISYLECCREVLLEAARETIPEVSNRKTEESWVFKLQSWGDSRQWNHVHVAVVTCDHVCSSFVTTIRQPDAPPMFLYLLAFRGILPCIRWALELCGQSWMTQSGRWTLRRLALRGMAKECWAWALRVAAGHTIITMGTTWAILLWSQWSNGSPRRLIQVCRFVRLFRAKGLKSCCLARACT